MYYLQRLFARFRWVITAAAVAVSRWRRAAWIAARVRNARVWLALTAIGAAASIISFRKQSRACDYTWHIFLKRCFCKACWKNTELNRNGDFLFYGYADSDDKIGWNFSVRSYAQVSWSIICSHSAAESRIWKLCKSWHKRWICSAWHAELKEVGKYLSLIHI